MTGLAVLTLDGIVRDPVHDSLITGGRDLAVALSADYRVVFLADSDDHDLWDLWLARHDVVEHAFVVERRPEDPEDIAIRRVRQIERLRGQGAAVELFVDPDPGVIATVMRLGVPCLLYVHPKYARPEFRPDYQSEVRPWDTLVAEIDRTKEMRAADPRYRRQRVRLQRPE